MQPKKVLIVEDDTDWRERIRGRIEGLGFNAILAGNTTEARTKMLSNPLDYALILLDPSLTKSGVDREGLAFLDQVREQDIQTPCVLLTATVTKELATDALNVKKYKVFALLDKKDFADRPASVTETIKQAIKQAALRTSGEKKTAKAKKARYRHKPPTGPSRPSSSRSKREAKAPAKRLREKYVDFDLQINQDGSVRARSGQGERNIAISLSVPNAIGRTVGRIEKKPTNENLLKKFGKRLYGIIFPDQINVHFNQTEAAARNKKSKIRIRLAIKPDALARLPWEFTYREEGGYFLAVNPSDCALTLSGPSLATKSRQAARGATKHADHCRQSKRSDSSESRRMGNNYHQSLGQTNQRATNHSQDSETCDSQRDFESSARSKT